MLHLHDKAGHILSVCVCVRAPTDFVFGWKDDILRPTNASQTRKTEWKLWAKTTACEPLNVPSVDTFWLVRFEEKWRGRDGAKSHSFINMSPATLLRRDAFRLQTSHTHTPHCNMHASISTVPESLKSYRQGERQRHTHTHTLSLWWRGHLSKVRLFKRTKDHYKSLGYWLDTKTTNDTMFIESVRQQSV